MSRPDIALQSPTIPDHNRAVANQVTQSVRDGKYCALLGPRFAGKTELLHFVQTELERDSSYVCVYINLREVEPSTQTGFFASLMSATAQGIAEQTGHRVPIPAVDALSGVGFRGFLESALTLIERDLVLMIDHLEGVPNDLLQALLISLRAAYMDQQSNEHRLVAVVSGALSLATLTVGESSPFRGIARRVFVGDLSESENQALVKAHTTSDTVKVSLAARARLLRATRGDLYLIAVICDKCMRIANEHPSRRLTSATVKRVMREFVRDEASNYEPLREAVQLVENDPDLLRCVLLLLERNTVPRRELPLPLSPDLDPLYLTGMVRKVNGDSYALRNEIYSQSLSQHFDPGRVGHVLTIAGRWDSAIDYLERGVRAGHERYRSELLAATINSMYAAEDVKRTAHYLARGLSAVFGIEEGYIHYLSPHNDVLTQVEQLGPTLEGALPITQTISISEDRLEARAYREGRYLRRHEESGRAVLAVPLSVPERESLGVVTVYDYLVDHELAQQRERVMQLLGYLNQAARAIQEVSARESQALRILDRDLQLEEKTRQLSLLHRISTLVQSMTDLDQMLNLVLTGATAHYGLGFNRVWLFLLNSEHTHLAGRMAIGDFTYEDAYRTWEHAAQVSFDEYARQLLAADAIEHTPIDMPTRELHILVSEHSDDMFSRTIFKRRTFRCSATSADRCALPREFQQRFEPEEVIAAPLLAGGECLGIIVADNKFSPRVHTSTHEDMLATFANQAAAAIVNARQRQQEQRRRELTETLREISTVIGGSLEIDKVLKLILEQMARVLTFDTASIQMLSPDHSKLEIIASKGFDDPASVEALAFPLEKSSPNVRVWRCKKPLRYRNVRELFPQFTDPKYHATRVRGWLGAPLVVDDKVIGVITLDSYTADLYTPEHEYLAMVFASQAAIAIQNACLFDSAQRRIRDLEIVNDVVQIISTKLDTQDLLQAIVSQIAEQLNCTHCTLFFPQKEKGELLLVPQVTHGVREEQMTRRFRPGEGLAGWVFQHGKSLVLADARKDPRFAPARERQEQPRSMLVAPVQVGDQTIGVISADQDEFGWFGESDRRLVDALTRQAGIAIERAAALALLHDIGKRIIGEQNVDDILQQIVSGAIKLTNTTSGAIYLVSEDGKSVIKSFQHPPDFDHPKPRMDREESLTRQVIATGEMVVFPDIHQDARVNPILHDRVRSMIAIPLKLDERNVIGVLYLNDADPHSFTETEISLLSTLATQAAIAIENARLYGASEQQAGQMRRLMEVSEALAKQTDLRTALQLIADAMKETMGYQMVAVCLRDQEDRIRLLASTGLTKDEKAKLGKVIGSWEEFSAPMQERFQISRSYFVPEGEYTWDDYKASGIVRDLGARLPGEWRADDLLRVPLVGATGQVLGVISVSDPSDRRRPDLDAVQALELFANHATAAIERASLYQRLQNVVAGVKAITEGITRSPREVYEQIARRACEVVGADSAVIYPYEAETLRFDADGWTGFNLQEPIPPSDIKQRVGTGLAASILRNGEVTVEDTSLPTEEGRKPLSEESEFTKRERVTAFVGLRLQVGERPVGILYINFRSRPHHFTEEELAAMRPFADQAALSIRIAQLYEQKRRALEGITVADQKIASSLELDEVIMRVVEQARVTLDATSAVLFPYDPRMDILRMPVFSGTLKHPDFCDEPNKRETVVARLRESNAPQFADDSSAHPIMAGEFVGREDIASSAGLPLTVADQIMGYLFVNYTEPHHFTDDEKQFFITLTNQAALAIHSARLSEELRFQAIVAGMAAWGVELAHDINREVYQIRSRADWALQSEGVLDDVQRLLREIDQRAEALSVVPIPARPVDQMSGWIAVPLDEGLRKWVTRYAVHRPEVQLRWELKCDETRVAISDWWLGRVMRHLVRNALDAMPEAGTLTIRSRVQEDRRAGVQVQDTGTGIAADMLPDLFRLPTSSKSGRYGFGLIIARFAVQQHGGEMWLERTEQGKGTTFAFTLPLAAESLV